MEKRFRVKKNAAAKRSDRAFRIRAKQLIAVMLALFVLVGAVRIGYIMIIKGDDYTSQAKKNQLYDREITAVRGTVYDRNMTPLVTSSSAWILTTNPYEIWKYFKKYNVKLKDDTVITTEADEVRKVYYNYISKGIAKILDMKKSDVYDIVSKPTKDDENKTTIGYKRIKKKVDATQRLALDKLFAQHFNCKTGTVVSDEEYKTYIQDRKTYKDILKYIMTSTDFFQYENDTIRIYPDNNFASKIIGVTNYDGDGVTGIELEYNSILKGKSGRRVTAKDAGGNAIDSSFETVVDPEEGKGVVLTIDSNIQMYLENALSQALKNTGAKGTFGIVMDVDSGAVLAISDKPDFDLNDPYTLSDENAVEKILQEAKENKVEKSEQEAKTEALYKQWNSYCLTSTYEPGSTFKIFTASAALEEGIATTNTSYYCNGGYQIPNGPVIHCANRSGHGSQSFTKGLMNSCNPFFISLGQKLGSTTFYKYFEAFGFTETTGIDLPGEASPVYHSLKNLKITELASTSFGQSFRISPIQLITATCAIANGGKLMQPYVVDSIVDTDGNIVSKTQPTVKRQVVSASTASTVCKMMEAVVEGGTGKNAYIPGYRVAGKTATSEKLDAAGGKDQLKYVASFVCFAPADDPKVAILVGVDEPPGEYRGGGVIAAPIAKEVMESTLKYLNVEPQYTAAELASVSKTAPDLIGESISNAKQKAANHGLEVKVVGSGSTVISQLPQSGQSIPEKGMIIVYTEEDSKTEVVEVPDFSSMSASQVNEKAHQVGLNIKLSGPASDAGAVAYNQNIAAGTKVTQGTTITVHFHTTTQAAD